MLTAQEILEEYTQCLLDPCYAITEYLKTFDKTQEGFVQFKLFPKQIEIVEAYSNHRFTMVTKPRQAGVSTTTAAYAAVTAVFADPNNPEAILILANKQDMAFEFLDKIKDFVSQFPRWVWGADYYGTPEKEAKKILLVDSKKEIKLPNGSRVKAVATSKNALRGFTPTWLIMDEAAFMPDAAITYSTALTALGTGGRVSLVSTPNGYDELYHKTYEQARNGDNDYHIVEMRWYQDPRYTTDQITKLRDLIWIHEENEDDIIEETRYTNFGDSEESIAAIYAHYEEMMAKGYKASSSWYRSMCRNLNNNKRMIAQELDVSFLGSGGNVIDFKDIQRQEKQNVRDAEWLDYDEYGNEIWIWEKPIAGHKYILSSDVARGDGEDFSTIVILDFTTMTQVMEFRSKLPSDLLGHVVDKWARIYNAMVVVDITGGVGVGTINKLLEMETPNLYYAETTNKPLDKKTTKIKYFTDEGKYPGFNCSAGLRTPIIAHLEMMIRTMGVTIRSRRMISEMNTFVFKNGRADHQDGFHDDLLMALAYALWVAEHSFKKLAIAKEQTKAMLGGWIMTNAGDRTPEDGYGRDGFVARQDRNKKVTAKKPKFTPQVAKNMQDPTGKYMWLFSGTK